MKAIVALFMLGALVLGAFAPPSGALAQPPETETLHETPHRCQMDTICGETVSIEAGHRHRMRCESCAARAELSTPLRRLRGERGRMTL